MGSRSGIRIPRAVLLALWLGRGHGLAASPEVVRHAMQSGAEIHRVAPAGADPVAFTTFLAQRLTPRTAVAAVLPSAGEPLGVPPAVAGVAAVVGEAVLVSTPTEHWALVPEVAGYGTQAEPGVVVTWRAERVDPWAPAVLAAVGQLRDAERELALALRTAADVLDSLDVAQWREDAGEVIAELSGNLGIADELPAGLSPRAARVLTEAGRLRAIVALATSDDGASVNLWQANQRSAALREVDRAARRALSAATVETH